MDIERRTFIGGTAALTFAGLNSAADARRPVPIRVDHHVHVHAPAILAFLPDYCASVSRFGKFDAAFTASLTPMDLLTAMERAGIQRTLVMSSGYLAESSMMSPQRPGAADLLRAANDWTANFARRNPDRLCAFVAIDPTTPTALPEIARWRSDRAVTGIKLHLTASGVDLRRDEDVAVLAAIFRSAAEATIGDHGSFAHPRDGLWRSRC